MKVSQSVFRCAGPSKLLESKTYITNATLVVTSSLPIQFFFWHKKLFWVNPALSILAYTKSYPFSPITQPAHFDITRSYTYFIYQQDHMTRIIILAKDNGNIIVELACYIGNNHPR